MSHCDLNLAAPLAKIGAALCHMIACSGVKAHKLPLEKHATRRDTAIMFGPERICLR